ncbi:hypothetical protein AAFF_G00027720 [Aldrovandia affinis]|uniref:Uncharacterized protein n=1 Tax=Aldrovandia affinis TaxID=143900 RepID=A0AAD7S4R7_9TELE|nr:hypothetical protein AAFF_G00027720 [Aldrovandia affinis]
MNRGPLHYSKWAERRSTVVYAVRSATFSSWKMLTLGAESSSWSQTPSTPGGENPPQQGRAGDAHEAPPEPEEEEAALQAAAGSLATPAATPGGPWSLVDVHEAQKQEDISDLSEAWSHRMARFGDDLPTRYGGPPGAGRGGARQGGPQASNRQPWLVFGGINGYRILREM